MKNPFYLSKYSSLFTLIVIAGSCFLACHQAEQKGKPVIALRDTAALTEKLYDSSQTPYICAMRSLRAAKSGDLKALAAYVHPIKGLTITHVAESIQNHEGHFSVEELNREAQKPTMLTIVNDYEQENVRKSTLSSLLQQYASSNNLKDDATPGRLFSSSKDIRRNYTGNGTYSLVPPLANNQTTISYHFSDSTNEMNWEEIVLRTETYKGKDYLVEILRAFWTP